MVRSPRNGSIFQICKKSFKKLTSNVSTRTWINGWNLIENNIRITTEINGRRTGKLKARRIRIKKTHRWN